jgi:ribonucleoside-triphosphate reductase
MDELRNKGNGLFGAGEQTGSIGVVTINLNRFGYEAKTKEDYFALLKKYLILAKDSLEIKRKIIETNLKNGLMPYTRAYLGTFQNHFSTIGVCGMNEASLNFLGKAISTPEGKQFTIDTLAFIRKMMKRFQNETGNLYNLEATPAESASYRLARLDKKVHPKIKTAGGDEPYLTNSTHLPVNFTDDMIEAVEHQNDIQPLYTGGTVFHTFLGEKVTDGKSCKELVKKIAYNTRLPYFSITPTFTICPEHGYITGEHHACPIEVKEKIAVRS